MSAVVSGCLRQLILCAGAAIALGAFTTDAESGEYVVRQCDPALGIATTDLSWSGDGSPYLSAHPNSGCDEFGLAVRSTSPGSGIVHPQGVFGEFAAKAPPGTNISAFEGAFGTYSSCCIDGLETFAEARQASGAVAGTLLSGPLGPSTWLAQGEGVGPMDRAWTAVPQSEGADEVAFGLRCAAGSCLQDAGGEARVRARSFRFVVTDVLAPSIVSLDGELADPGWVQGSRQVGVKAEDRGGGLASLDLAIGDAEILHAVASCQRVSGHFVRLRPCPLAMDEERHVDTASLSDGTHVLTARAADLVGNVQESSLTLNVDNTPPSAPGSLAVVGGSGWRSVNGFRLVWDEAPQVHAPIVRAHARICAVATTHCVETVADAKSSVLDLELPSRGEYTTAVWLEDAAGNVDPDSRATQTMRFDDEAPGSPELDVPSGWLGTSAASRAVARMSVAALDVPVSGIEGYAVSTDGTDPPTIPNALGSRVERPLGDFPEGLTRLRVRAISGAGVVSTAAEATVRIDRSAPSIDVRVGASAGPWSRSPVSITATAQDQDDLSGMGASSSTPSTGGGHILATGPTMPSEVLPGGHGEVTFTTDGRHTVRFKAVDVAGNESVEKEVSFKIDRTAPVGRFRALDADDPALVVADVSDATSGVGDGWIEYRPVEGGAFKRLPTNLRDGVLSARMPDGEIPDGQYAVRAIVTDVAGNRAIVNTRADGGAMALALPLRASPTLDVEARVLGQKACRSARRKKSERRKRGCRRASARPLTVDHGRRLLVEGSLTAAGGPLAGMTLLVEAQTVGDGAFVPLGTTVTDGRGRFRRAIPPGPSRTIRVRFVGTNRLGGATGAVTTKVPAAVALKVDRRRLLNGQVVRFHGRLLGKPVPAGGKLVALQAKVPGGWRTFATPRANARGRFKHRYRFTSTTGLRRYRFRALVEAEPAYPYARGLSKVVTVTVRGR